MVVLKIQNVKYVDSLIHKDSHLYAYVYLLFKKYFYEI